MENLMKCDRCEVMPVFFELSSNGRQHFGCVKCLCCGRVTKPFSFTSDIQSAREAVENMIEEWNAGTRRRKFRVIRRHRRAGRKAASV